MAGFTLEASRNVDTASVFPDSVLRGGLAFKTIPSSDRLWDNVNDKLAWQRCREINKARLKKFGVIVEELPKNLHPDEEDDIPM